MLNSIAKSVTKVLPQIPAAISEARPLSHAATIALLGTSIYFVHEGAASILPENLVKATTLAMIACEWLQWTTLGRIERLNTAKDFRRADVLKAQAFGIGALQVLLYTMAVVSFAHAAGQNWGMGTMAFYGSLALAALFASLNFVAKWTSCEAVTAKARPAPQPRPGSEVLPELFSDEEAGIQSRMNVIALNQNRRSAQEVRDRLNFLTPDESARSKDAIRQRRNRRKAA